MAIKFKYRNQSTVLKTDHNLNPTHMRLFLNFPLRIGNPWRLNKYFDFCQFFYSRQILVQHQEHTPSMNQVIVSEDTGDQ